LNGAVTGRLIDGGNATIYVTEMDRSVRFYTDTLGLRLALRAGDDWASIDAGKGLTLGLHVAPEGAPRPGQPGAITVGLAVSRPIEEVVGTLRERGVPFRGPVVDQGFVKLAFFADPDGNSLYLAETPG